MLSETQDIKQKTRAKHGRLFSASWVPLRSGALAQTGSEWLSDDKNGFWSHNGEPSERSHNSEGTNRAATVG